VSLVGFEAYTMSPYEGSEVEPTMTSLITMIEVYRRISDEYRNQSIALRSVRDLIIRGKYGTTKQYIEAYST
jgi:hypothetical protein